MSIDKLYDIVGLNAYARVLCDDKGKLDNLFQENDEDDNESDDDDIISILQYHDVSHSLQPTFRTKRVCDNVPAHLVA